MKKRGIVAVILLPFVTFGIYGWYWFVKTKGELNDKGANILTAWVWLIPFGSIYWLWKYYEGAEKVTNGKVNGILNFVLSVFVTGLISMAICQDAYNNMGMQQLTEDQPSTTPPAPAPASQTVSNPPAPDQNTQ